MSAPTNVYSIPVADITTSAPRRTTHDVTELARSMNDVGQLQPIILTPDLRLVAGWHRLQAAKMLGWSHIDARYVDDVDAEIAAIDENLMRHELHYVERGEWLARPPRCECCGGIDYARLLAELEPADVVRGQEAA